MTAATAALQAVGLMKTYDAVRVIDEVDLTLMPGQIHALLGPNGAGKTTLLRMLLGLVRPDAGEIRLLGRPARAGLDGVAGFVESPTFWPYLTVRKTLVLLANLDGNDGHDTDELLTTVGLATGAATKVGNLSVGMRQRLGLAAALQRRPRLLLLDEPSTGLDPAGVRDLHTLLRRLAADGTAILLSSHLMAEVDSLCTHATVIAGGRVARSDTLAELRSAAPDPRVRLRTSDDTLAFAIATTSGLAPQIAAEGMTIRGTTAAVDSLVLELAARGVCIRELLGVGTPLGELFLTLTADSR